MLVSVAGGVGLIVLVACLFGFCATVAHKHRLWYQVLVWLPVLVPGTLRVGC